MARPDPSHLTLVGRTSNATYYRYEPRILLVYPVEGLVDDAATARENMEFQRHYLAENDPPGVVLSLLDGAAGQDRGARNVYKEGFDPSIWLAVSMIGGTAMSRAIGSFFLGLTRLPIPFKMFSTLEEALPWARGLLAEKRAGGDPK